MYNSFQIPTILQIKNSTTKQLKQSVDGQHEWTLEFENTEKTLKDNIQEKRRETLGKKMNIISSAFSEAEILQMLDCVLSALMAFHFKKLVHGDIRPITILINEKSSSES